MPIKKDLATSLQQGPENRLKYINIEFWILKALSDAASCFLSFLSSSEPSPASERSVILFKSLKRMAFLPVPLVDKVMRHSALKLSQALKGPSAGAARARNQHAALVRQKVVLHGIAPPQTVKESLKRLRHIRPINRTDPHDSGRLHVMRALRRLG